MDTITRTEHRRQAYGESYPLARGGNGNVQQGHANWCAEHGHAVYSIDGVRQPYCPRCGADNPEVAPAAVPPSQRPENAPEAPAQRVTKYGRFPLIECERCGATGRMPYNVKGGVCFDCKGSGLVVVREHRAAYVEHMRQHGPKHRHSIELVRRHLDGERVQVATGGRWYTVEAVRYELTEGSRGSSTTTTQGCTITASHLGWVVTFTLSNGTEVSDQGTLLHSRILPATK